MLCRAVGEINPLSHKAADSGSRAASKQPVAKPLAKPPVAKPAKPLLSLLSPAAGKGASGKAAGKKPVAKAPPQPQAVDTVSNDDSEEELPTLISSDESDASDLPPVSTRRDAPAAAAATQAGAGGAGKARPGPSAQPAEGKPAPSGVPAMGKQAPGTASASGKPSAPVAKAEPIFKSVSRGYLAQQSALQAASSSSGSSISESKEVPSGTGFNFDRAVGGASKAPAKEPAYTMKQTAMPANAASRLGKWADSFQHVELGGAPVGAAPEEVPSMLPCSVLICTCCILLTRQVPTRRCLLRVECL